MSKRKTDKKFKNYFVSETLVTELTGIKDIFRLQTLYYKSRSQLFWQAWYDISEQEDNTLPKQFASTYFCTNARNPIQNRGRLDTKHSKPEENTITERLALYYIGIYPDKKYDTD